MGSRNPIWRWPNETIWRKYCGFLDLTKEEFYEIQRELLQDELLLVHRSPLGQSLLQGSLPKNIDEFRQACRLTTYRDYRPFLENHQEFSLAKPAYRWADSDTSGGENRCVPYTKRGYETAVDNSLAALILSSANKKEEVSLRPQDRMFWDPSDQSSLLSNLACEMTQRFGFTNIHILSDSKAEEYGVKEKFDWGRGMIGGLDILVGPDSDFTQLGQAFSSSRPILWVSLSLVVFTCILPFSSVMERIRSKGLNPLARSSSLWIRLSISSLCSVKKVPGASVTSPSKNPWRIFRHAGQTTWWVSDLWAKES